MFEYNYIVAQGICVTMLVYGDEDLPFIEIKDLTHVYHAGQANAHEALSRVSLTVGLRKVHPGKAYKCSAASQCGCVSC